MYGPVSNDEYNVINFDDVCRTWAGLEDTIHSGLAKSIGTANFNGLQVKRLLNVARINPVINNIDCDAYMSHRIFCEYLKSNNIALIAENFCGE